MPESAHDICVCGDSRRQHRADGMCLFNKSLGGVGHGGAPDCDGFKPATEGWDRDDTKTGMFRDHRCTRCNDGAKPCPNGQTGPSRNCEHPHARND